MANALIGLISLSFEQVDTEQLDRDPIVIQNWGTLEFEQYVCAYTGKRLQYLGKHRTNYTLIFQDDELNYCYITTRNFARLLNNRELVIERMPVELGVYDEA